MKTEDIDILALFRQTGAYLSGHFLLTSGLHSAAYLQCARVLQFPEHAARLGAALAAALRPLAPEIGLVVSPAMGGLHSAAYLQCARVLQFPEHAARLGAALAAALRPIAPEIGLVVSPAMGGLIIGHEVARALGVRHIFTERGDDRKMLLRRGFAVEPGERAVVIEDVITTGVSTREVVDLLHAAGATVVAAASIIDRSGGAADVGVPRAALATLHVETWAPDDCPLCLQGLPAIKPGSRPS